MFHSELRLELGEIVIRQPGRIALKGSVLPSLRDSIERHREMEMETRVGGGERTIERQRERASKKERSRHI